MKEFAAQIISGFLGGFLMSWLVNRFGVGIAIILISIITLALIIAKGN